MSLSIDQVNNALMPAVQSAEGTLATAIGGMTSASNLSNTDLMVFQHKLTTSALTVNMVVGITASRKQLMEGVIQKF